MGTREALTDARIGARGTSGTSANALGGRRAATVGEAQWGQGGEAALLEIEIETGLLIFNQCLLIRLIIDIPHELMLYQPVP